MTNRKRIILIVLSALSLILVGALAHAQIVQRSANPSILSGSDIGFRVTGRAGDHVLGTMVVRINGDWVEAQPAGGVRALTGQIDKF